MGRFSLGGGVCPPVLGCVSVSNATENRTMMLPSTLLDAVLQWSKRVARRALPLQRETATTCDRAVNYRQELYIDSNVSVVSIILPRCETGAMFSGCR